ncbi:MAG: N-acetylmuramoyl-L-alanine amidase [Thermodesulfovibrionales bacterium]|nr:N-acetylmuramoyl-L-alanine amidase [Thermodesulfovibrionales bacterium]
MCHKIAIKGKTLVLIISLLTLFLNVRNSYANEMIDVKSLRHWATNDSIRVVVDLSGVVEFTKGKLSNPERLFFDIKNSKLLKGIQPSYTIGDSLIKSIRLGQFNPNTVRIVFDLEKPDYEYKVFMLEDPMRLVIDFMTKTGNTSDSPKESPKPQQPQPKPQPPSQPLDVKTEAKLTKKIVVLDAGHGGHDPGAVGPTGLYEKDVVLDIALRTRTHLNERYPHYEVHLTREKDVFIPLDKRAQIANKLNADLFISIHANASPNRIARGIETYLLNWTDDEEALKVAARENAISLKQMKEMKNEVGIILTSLERESKRDESIKVAGYVQNAMATSISEDYPNVPNLGVKQALFYVLVGAKMPSSLLEVSFISNKEEEKLLSSEDYRDKLAHSIAEGINGYFMNLPANKITKYSKPKLPDKKIATAEPIKYEKKSTQPQKRNNKKNISTSKIKTRRI